LDALSISRSISVPFGPLDEAPGVDTCKSCSNGILGTRDEVRYNMMSKKWQMPFITEKKADEG